MIPDKEQINRTIHEALGKCYHQPSEDGHTFCCEQAAIFADVSDWVEDDRPDYCSSLDLCALAEAEVERRGLTTLYEERLTYLVERTNEFVKFRLFDVVTAGAEVRATALAAVLGGEE